MSNKRIALVAGGNRSLRGTSRSALVLAAAAALLLGLVRIPDGSPSAASASQAHEQRPVAHR